MYIYIYVLCLLISILAFPYLIFPYLAFCYPTFPYMSIGVSHLLAKPLNALDYNNPFLAQ